MMKIHREIMFLLTLALIKNDDASLKSCLIDQIFAFVSTGVTFICTYSRFALLFFSMFLHQRKAHNLDDELIHLS